MAAVAKDDEASVHALVDGGVDLEFENKVGPGVGCMCEHLSVCRCYNLLYVVGKL